MIGILNIFWGNFRKRTTDLQRSYLYLHIAVFLFGFTAILGDLIQLSALVLVWWRVLITCTAFLFLRSLRQKVVAMDRKTVLQYFFIGWIVMLHWLSFYGAIKFANASITLACLATTSLFSSIFEPLLTKKPFRWYELMLGAAIIPGILLIKNQTSITMVNGFYIGLASAFFASIFSILNKRMVGKADAMTTTFLELGGGFVLLSLILPFYWHYEPSATFLPSTWDWFWLIILSLLCTNLAYTLGIKALQHLSAFTTALTVNLEPVYGIIMAIFILKENEELSPNFYWGVLLILGVVAAYPFIAAKMEKKT